MSPNISNLTNLRKLDVSNNFLKEIPREIILLTGTLTDLKVQGNGIPVEETRDLIDAMPSTSIRF